MKRTKKKPTAQYTIRGVPDDVDRTLRLRAKDEDKSLNELVLDVLARAAGVGNGQKVYTDLDHLIGTWVHDPEFDAAIAEQDQIDEELWR